MEGKTKTVKNLDLVCAEPKKAKVPTAGLAKQIQDQMKELKKAINSNTGKGVHPFVHIYKRQGMYIGSKITCISDQWIVEPSTKEGVPDKIVKKKINYNQGLERIIMEILSNCKDNFWASQKVNFPMKYIKITVDRESGEISMENDGAPIPVVLTQYSFENPITGEVDVVEKYPAEKFFGDVNFGTNLEKETEKKKSSGLNGLGGKLTNIFSKKFTITINDPANAKSFEMTFSKNGLKRSTPIVKDYKGKKAFTRITFTPDYEFFGIEAGEDGEIVEDDLYYLIKKHAYDAAFISPVKVYFNDETLEIGKLEDYVRLFYPDEEKSPIIKFKALNGDEGCIVQNVGMAPKGLEQVSFINGIRTAVGGVHVNKWDKLIFGILKDHYNSRKKNFLSDTAPFYNHVVLFLRCETFDHVDFDSQNKEKLTAPSPFKMHGVIDEKPIVAKEMVAKFEAKLRTRLRKVLEWECVKLIDESFTVSVVPRKGNKEDKYSEKHIHANLMGPWNPKIHTRPRIGALAEGDSAANLGQSLRNCLENGADDWGIQALRGKINNAEKMTTEQVEQAATLKTIRDFYGLQMGVDYSLEENRRTLNYDYGIALTDSDDDGIHIQSLIIACLSQFKGLLESGFFGAFNTFNVILIPKKSLKGEKIKFFYSQRHYNSWRQTPEGKKIDLTKYNATYYKGLGSYEPGMVDYHADPENRKILYYIKSKKDIATMNLAFKNTAKEKAERKDWLWNHLKGKGEDGECPIEGKVNISTFINHLLVDYHKTSVNRAIPSLLDGFKQVARQIMYTGLECLGVEKKSPMTNFIGMMMSKAFYHHGPSSAHASIVTMAQGLVNSNNIPYILGQGQYGNRHLRKPSADRYLALQFDKIARAVFRKEDTPLLTHTDSSGEKAEWVTYLPVVCNILINGAEGVATGFTTKIPLYNPKDVVAAQREWILSKDERDDMEDLVPWYRSYRGTITYTDSKNFVAEGVMKKETGGWWRITEVPVDMKGITLCEHLTELSKTGKELEKIKAKTSKKGKAAKKVAKKATNGHELVKKRILDIKDANKKSDNEINIMFKPAKDFIPDINTKGNMSLLRKSYKSTFCALDQNGVPVYYDSAIDVLKAFCEARLPWYSKRRKFWISFNEERKKIEESRLRYVRAVIDGEVDMSTKEEEVVAYLEENEYHKVFKAIKDDPTEPDGSKDVSEQVEDHSESKKSGYDYLLSMQMRSMTVEKIESLKKLINTFAEKIKVLRKTTPEEMWLKDLDDFEKAYDHFMKVTVVERKEIF